MIFNSEATPQWSKFVTLVLAPVRNTRDEGDDETCIDICTVTALQGWSLFGRDAVRELHPIHDTMLCHRIIAPLFHAVAVSSLPVIYQDAETITPPCSLYDLCDRLAEIIHEALDAEEVDTPARDDAFESHPLCEMRETIGRRAGYFGI